ncbi:alkanesulfonate monooxygenase SsuD/methylene tetrahydromethanopterin reductase-like flavin-dependent oxidoreductase (luciferase family) [Nocardia kruczakiae]|uniref:Alkanesulfonate monooxygenase SsuD/methylene tetrahydromethanopterin reductase-like flavin-dependent oxidoreductase (Luciferase family) n=1 Tax=Nocardia kruczakiae TaxID=261477 RepID=A0ABU1X8A1_9NOCA|nr:LLM class flavin-dependent oxidoreductase [Nocardia kruczakiae]MDR7166773.1 alkanesulfonate monooxygenase SsuD/methylene tetrahydromethanopterin reductase-like flavin-dependent oxidoreductase (luciferase family) [Nocardia kruczakiae]
MSSFPPLLGVELSGTGIHPASWRRADSRAEELFTPGYWLDAITAVDRAGLDFVFLPDSFGVDASGYGPLDAIALAARAAAATRNIGLIPQATVTHTEPFHVSKAIAALDYATYGRAGWEVAVSADPEQTTLFGRKQPQDDASLWREAEEAIEVVTRLWDSWEDDAEIRDLATGRFIDRDRLHYIDFEGENFSVKGPSITPRPPQGQPPIAVRAESPASTRLAVHRADLIRVGAADLDEAAALRTQLRSAVAAAGRSPDEVRILLDVEVHLAATEDRAHAELGQLDAWGPPAPPATVRHLGTADGLRALLDRTQRACAADGLVLRPLAVPAFTAALDRPARSLRSRIGLTRPANRYALARG